MHRWTKIAAVLLAAVALLPSPAVIAATSAAAASSTGPYAAVIASTKSNLAGAVFSNGEAYVWGENAYGQIAGYSGDTARFPRRITDSRVAGQVKALSLGNKHLTLLKSDGTVWASGNNTAGQLGNGGTSPVDTLQLVTGLPAAAAVSAGNDHTLAVTVSGGVYGWGSNGKGQLGRDTATMPFASVPQTIPGLSSGISKVAAGGDFSLALTVTGTVYAWGDSEYGQVGNGTVSGSVYEPTAVLNNVVDIAAGVDHALALTGDGLLYEWGKKLGSTTPAWIGTPTLVTTTVPDFNGFQEISCGYDHCVALTSAKKLFAWGTNDLGQVGPTGTMLHPTPVLVTQIVGSLFAHVSAENQWTSVLTEDHALYSWGSGLQGQLGNGEYNNYGSPAAADFTQTGPLKSLALKDVPFNETFQPDLYKYTASVPSSVTDVEVLAEAFYPLYGTQVSIVTVTGSVYISGPVHLAAGKTTTIRVEGWEPVEGYQSYFINVTREGPPAGVPVPKPLYSYEVINEPGIKVVLAQFDQPLDNGFLNQMGEDEELRSHFLMNGSIDLKPDYVVADHKTVYLYWYAWDSETEAPVALPDIASITFKNSAVFTLQGAGNAETSVPVVSQKTLHEILAGADPAQDGLTIGELVAYLKLHPDINGNGVPNELGDAAMLLDWIGPKFVTYPEESATSA